MPPLPNVFSILVFTDLLYPNPWGYYCGFFVVVVVSFHCILCLQNWIVNFRRPRICI